MVDFSIVIPHRGSTLGLWATITSCEEELKNSPFNYNYVVVSNGEAKENLDLKNFLYILQKAGKLKTVINNPEPLSPPRARQLGSEAADGDILFFLDNHCLVTKDYFARSMMDFEKYDIDLLHSTTQYYADDTKHYQYILTLAHNFWATSNQLPDNSHKPYKCVAGGHGGFAVRKSTWKDIGGYGPPDLFKGYGGEELYVDLKLWQHGKSVWIDPLVLHYHYAGDRGYRRHYTDEFFVNMLVCARVIGGAEWMNKVFESFITPGRFLKYTTDKTMYDLLMIAEGRSKAHAAELEASRLYSLDELFVWFRRNCISF